jgi:phage baseplate assembly protein W
MTSALVTSRGLKREGGGLTGDFDHFRQSIRDILVTPVGTRVMRRTYGSALPYLIDKPMTDVWIMKIYTATAIALALWEPRCELKQVTIKQATRGGRLVLSLSGYYFPRGHLGDKSLRVPFGDLAVVIAKRAG